MTKNKSNSKLGKIPEEENNSSELNKLNTANSTDKFDWDFILEREWSRTKK
jgi:hypothetical protein